MAVTSYRGIALMPLTTMMVDGEHLCEHDVHQSVGCRVHHQVVVAEKDCTDNRELYIIE